MPDPVPQTNANTSVVHDSIENVSQETTTKETTATISTKEQAIVFTGHNAYMMSVARMNRDTSQFTDVILVCLDGQVVAHRLVLAAASSSLKIAFLEVEKDGIQEHTILVPDVKKSVVAGLVDFLYTGKLILSRSNARDMQLLVRLLGIDPENVRVEAIEEVAKKRLTQTQLTTSMGLVVKQPAFSDVNKDNAVSTGNNTSDNSGKPLPIRASKRRASQESSGSNGSGKDAKLSVVRAGPTSPQPTSSYSVPLGRGTPRTRGRPRAGTRPGSAGGRQSVAQYQPAPVLTGYHDMSNVETWVCAICKCYDPMDAGYDVEGTGDTTEWIGCDCNRWYHKICTRLAVVDETFSCKMVKLECLPLT